MTEERRFEGIVRVLRERWWVILLAVVVTMGAAAAFATTREKRYTSTATLFFRNTTGNLLDQPTTSVGDPAREAATNFKLVSLTIVADRTARALGIPRGEVTSAVKVSASGQTDLVNVAAETTSPTRSARIANAYARSYIDFRRTADQRQLTSGVEQLQRSLDALPPEQQAGSEGERLRDRIDQLTVARALTTGNAELAQPARVPTSASYPNVPTIIALGGILGLALGLALAVVVARLDRTVRDVDELETLFRLPVIGEIPQSRQLRSGTGETAPLGPREAEAFRELRANLRFLDAERSISPLLVVSALPQEGKSTIAMRLSETMAAMGDKVILVEADLRKPTELKDITERTGHGLSAVLSDGRLDSEIAHVTVTDPGGEPRTLDVLPAGPTPPNPTELLESRRMRDMLDDLAERYDVVLVDTPALTVVSDALSLVAEDSTIVVVAAIGKSSRNSVEQLARQIDLLRGRKIGIIANMATSGSGTYHDYYYGAYDAMPDARRKSVLGIGGKRR
jgi:capsular exopolysaccharide synthesis family protein